MKTINFALAASGLAALGFALGITTAGAAELAAYRGHKVELGGINGTAYYTIEKDGFRVVATLADADSRIVRFEAVLAPGQSVVLSSPATGGELPARVEISRRNERIEVQASQVTN